MILLNRIKPHPRSRKRARRLGHGPGSGRGKTSGRGHKGAMQHGQGPRAGFEGGQMPLIRTVPKRGFTARSKARYQVLNVGDLEEIQSKDPVTREWLYENGFISNGRVPVKILGDGTLKKAICVRVQACSRSAVKKIEAAGGKVEPAEAR